MSEFEKLNISPELKRAVKDMGFVNMTPIQEKTLEAIMSGRDVIGQAQTGSGKTAAFALPCIEKTDPENDELQAVILAPTRELALQICAEIRKMLKYTDGIKVLPVYGGQPIIKQIAALRKGIQIVVGTPGRVIDHIKRHTLKMKSVKYVVLDEADEMLNMGFREDMEKILKKIPEDRQTLLFSATMPKPIIEITDLYQKDPVHIKAEKNSGISIPQIEQFYIEIKERTKIDAVCRLIDHCDPELAMVFCGMKRRVDEVTKILRARGLRADGLHGDMDQTQRDEAMNKFRRGETKVLVATDVAARGLDVENVGLIINYDLPQENEYYVHRIGRTGRAGKKGSAYSFVSGKEKHRIKEISEYTGAKIKLVPLPSFADISNAKADRLLNEIGNLIESGGLEKYIALVENMKSDGRSAEMLAAALLKRELYDPDTDFFDEKNSVKDKIKVLYLDVGKNDGIRVKDVIGAIAGECGISGSDIGNVELHEDHTFVEVPGKYVKDVLKGMKNKKIKKKKVIVSVSS